MPFHIHDFSSPYRQFRELKLDYPWLDFLQIFSTYSAWGPPANGTEDWQEIGLKKIPLELPIISVHFLLFDLKAVLTLKGTNTRRIASLVSLM